MSAPLLSIQNISAGYDGRDVLRGVSIDVTEGQFCAVIGPNGHGKTTVMRAICGLIPARSGKVVFDGQDITGLDPASRRGLGIAMVPQGDMLFPDMSVRENLLLGAHIERDTARIGRKLDTIHEIFPVLGNRADQLAYTLSGGERRMLAIGRALAADSKLLIVDEPSLGLSPKIVDEVYAALSGLGSLGVTVLLVEENVSRASDFADVLYLIDQGDVVWSGASDDVESSSDILATYLGA
ncbi:ABC transporter ATP-binding protein [Octadecabacter sp.]|nr:ABC transporter ATP-binding protein [Octadecabacter sp.]